MGDFGQIGIVDVSYVERRTTRQGNASTGKIIEVKHHTLEAIHRIIEEIQGGIPVVQIDNRQQGENEAAWQ